MWKYCVSWLDIDWVVKAKQSSDLQRDVGTMFLPLVDVPFLGVQRLGFLPFERGKYVEILRELTRYRLGRESKAVQ